MKVQVVIEVEVTSVDHAKDWAAGVLSVIQPKCYTCRGTGTVYRRGVHFDNETTTCWTCHGSTICTDGHPLKPRLVGAREVLETRKR